MQFFLNAPLAVATLIYLAAPAHAQTDDGEGAAIHDLRCGRCHSLEETQKSIGLGTGDDVTVLDKWYPHIRGFSRDTRERNRLITYLEAFLLGPAPVN